MPILKTFLVVTVGTLLGYVLAPFMPLLGTLACGAVVAALVGIWLDAETSPFQVRPISHALVFVLEAGIALALGAGAALCQTLPLLVGLFGLGFLMMVFWPTSKKRR